MRVFTGRKMVRVDALDRVVHPRQLPQELKALAAIIADVVAPVETRKKTHDLL